MITCPNCGAQIKEESKKCIYCGYINIEGAKKMHERQIEEIKEDIKELKKEPEKALKKGMSKSLKIGDKVYAVNMNKEIILFNIGKEPIENGMNIANKCNLILELGKTLLPNYPVPTGYTIETYLSKLVKDV